MKRAAAAWAALAGHLPQHFARGMAIAWGAFALALTFTLASWRYAASGADREAEQHFQFESQQIRDAVRERMADYEQVLRGGAALFAAAVSVERHKWKSYAEALHVERRYPGIQGIGFARVVAPGEREAHIRAVRAEGFPDYRIHPAGERAEYTSIVYLEPFAGRNLRAFGYDMFAEPVRRAAMERARDTGEAALSGKVTLVQETGQDVQAGCLLYFPIYRHGAPQATRDERRAALAGYVYAPFRMKDLMRGILGVHPGHLDLEIYDGADASPAAMMHDDARHGEAPAHFVREMPLEVSGRAWTLRLSSTPVFEAETANPYPWLVLGGGVAVSLLVYLLIAATVTAREKDLRARNILDVSPAVIYAAQLHGDYGATFISPNVREQLGYAPKDFTGDSAFWADNIHPEDRERVLTHQQRLFTEGRIHCEYRFRHRDGSWHWMNDLAVLVRDAAGEPKELVGSWFDTTERHLAQHATEEALRAKIEFMNNVTHELRTPLNSVIGFAELLKDGVPGPLNAKQARFVADIHENGLRLLKLVQGILDMSRFDAAGVELEREPVDIGAALKERLAAHRKAAEARGVTMGAEVAADAGSVQLDPNALRRILDALLDNAVKFNREAGTVRVSAQRADGTLEIAVADTGIGIAPADLPKLFQPLVQLDAALARNYGGIGLGLALAQRLAEWHGGAIEVKSEPGRGSTFTLRLPL